MVTFDREFLASVGLASLTDEDQDSLIEALLTELEDRAGRQLTAVMPAADLDLLERAFADGDDAAAQALLERACPGYHDIVRDHEDRLAAEVLAWAGRILGELGGATGQAEPAPIAAQGQRTPYLLATGGWRELLAPGGELVVAVSPDRSRCYARRAVGPAVILSVPPTIVLDPSRMWCGDDGAVSAWCPPEDVLVWQVPVDTSEVTVVQATAWPGTEIAGLAEPHVPAHGSFTIRDVRLSAERRGDDIGLRVDGERQRHLADFDSRTRIGFVVPPDQSRFLAFYANPASVLVSPYDYARSIPRDAQAMMWQEEVDLDQWPAPPQFISSVAFNPTTTNAALSTDTSVQLFDVPGWQHRRSILHAHESVRTQDIDLPLPEPVQIAWAGTTLVILSDGRAWAAPFGAVGVPKIVTLDVDTAAVRGCNSVGDSVVAVLRDRAVVTIDQQGLATTRALSGDEPVRTAAPNRWGGVFVGTDSGVEYHRRCSGIRSVLSFGHSPVVGIAACHTSSSWAIVRFADRSFAVVEVRQRELVAHRSLPNWPDGLGAVEVVGAAWPHYNQWALLVPRGPGVEESYVATPDRPRLHGSDWLAYMESAGAYVTGTEDGLLRFSQVTPNDSAIPWPVRMGVPITAIATSSDPRVLAVVAGDKLRMLRLLT